MPIDADTPNNKLINTVYKAFLVSVKRDSIKLRSLNIRANFICLYVLDYRHNAPPQARANSEEICSKSFGDIVIHIYVDISSLNWD